MSEHVYKKAIGIHAPAESVWADMVDVERWPTWTESIQAITLLDSGPLRVGSRARVQQPRLPTVIWTVDQVEPGRSFSWTNASPGLRSAASHRIEPTPDGCQVTLELRQAGPLAGGIQLVLGRLTRRYLTLEAEGLKRRAESGP